MILMVRQFVERFYEKRIAKNKPKIIKNKKNN